MDCEICHATLSIERNDFNNEILIKCDDCGWETEEILFLKKPYRKWWF